MRHKIWQKKDNCSSIEEVSLRNFGVSSPTAIAEWEDKFKNNEYHIYGLDEAVALASDYINNGYKFAILGDYDADGITGTAILALGLKAAGAGHMQLIIPDRITEGYGAKPMHVDTVEPGEDNKTCLVFVDNGIACIDALKHAKELGYRVIILDHHLAETNDALKYSDALVDPEAEESLYGEQKSDFNSYCGAGLAFSFIRKLINDTGMIKKLLCFAAIGTVCDVMPLQKENYCFVKHGLSLMKDRSTCTSGLFALTTALNMDEAVISAKDLGFSYGPVINAQSRMNGRAGTNAILWLLLYDKDIGFNGAVRESERLAMVNTERKNRQKEGLARADQVIQTENLANNRPLVVYIPGTGEGIVGIIAAHIAEKYHIPAIVLTDGKDDAVIKGSGRSFGNYNMIKALRPASDILLSCGGHPGACGLALKRDDLNTLRKILSETFPKDYKYEDTGVITYDLEIDASQIPESLDEELMYGPYGKGHDEIVFKIDNFDILPSPAYINILSDGTSAKLVGNNATAFAFKNAEIIPGGITRANIIGTLSKNYFRGCVSDRVEIIDIEDADADKKIIAPPPMPDKMPDSALTDRLMSL